MKAVLERALFLKLGLSRADAAKGVRVVLDTIAEALRNGGEVKINNFGVFEVRERAARMGRNPRTGEPVPIPPTRTVFFRAADTLLNPKAEEATINKRLTPKEKASVQDTLRLLQAPVSTGPKKKWNLDEWLDGE